MMSKHPNVGWLIGTLVAIMGGVLAALLEQRLNLRKSGPCIWRRLNRMVAPESTANRSPLP